MELHKAIFNNDIDTFESIMKDIKENAVQQDEKTADVKSEWVAKDIRGNTPLHLAVALGRKEMIKRLIDEGHPVLSTYNEDGWTPLCESISYGDIDTLMQCMQRQSDEITSAVNTNLPTLINEFQNTLGDFYMEIQMDFRSWVPFLSRFCPRDTCKIWKKGHSVRMDHSLIGLEAGKWVYANVSTIFTIDEEKGPMLIALNHDRKIKQQIYPLTRLEEFQSASFSEETQRKLDVLQSIRSPLMLTSFDTSKMNITMYRSISSNILSFFRRRSSDKKVTAPAAQEAKPTIPELPESKGKETANPPADFEDEEDGEAIDITNLTGDIEYCTEKVGKYVAQRYRINNLELKTQLRLEHLTDKRIEDLGLDTWFFQDEVPDAKEKPRTSSERDKIEGLLKKNLDAAKKSTKDGNYWDNIDVRQFALPAPEESVTFEEYFGVEGEETNSDEKVYVGRRHRIRHHTRPMKARIWLSSFDILKENHNITKDGEVFPWKLSQLLTLLDVLDLGSVDASDKSSALGQLKTFLRLSGIDNGFPVQLEVPMFGLVNAQVRFSDFLKLKEEPTGRNTPTVKTAERAFDKDFFAIPEDYMVDEVFAHLAKK